MIEKDETSRREKEERSRALFFVRFSRRAHLRLLREEKWLSGCDEKEEKLLLDHNYDGIEEFNYPLPDWWVATFVGGIVFAIFYIYYYQVAGGLSLREEYNRDMQKLSVVKAEQEKILANFDTKKYEAWKETVSLSDYSKEIYEENCLSCHEEGGKGDIGPNLTDRHWKNLKEVNPRSVFMFIKNGNEDNGMPAWGEIISQEELYAATAYVLSVRNKMLKGKEPQGVIIDD